GSFPRPGWLADTSERTRLKFRFDGALLREALDDATRICLQEQAELGLDVVTDGEQRRPSFIFHLAGAWDGIDLVTYGKKNLYRNKPGERSVPRVTGKIVRRT